MLRYLCSHSLPYPYTSVGRVYKEQDRKSNAVVNVVFGDCQVRTYTLLIHLMHPPPRKRTMMQLRRRRRRIRGLLCVYLYRLSSHIYTVSETTTTRNKRIHVYVQERLNDHMCHYCNRVCIIFRRLAYDAPRSARCACGEWKNSRRRAGAWGRFSASISERVRASAGEYNRSPDIHSRVILLYILLQNPTHTAIFGLLPDRTLSVGTKMALEIARASTFPRTPSPSRERI